MDTFRALILIPIGFAGAFSAFPFVEDSMSIKSLADAAVVLAMLSPAYLYIAALMFYVNRREPFRELLGLSKTGWKVAISLAYSIGAGIVLLSGLA